MLHTDILKNYFKYDKKGSLTKNSRYSQPIPAEFPLAKHPRKNAHCQRLSAFHDSTFLALTVNILPAFPAFPSAVVRQSLCFH